MNKLSRFREASTTAQIYNFTGESKSYFHLHWNEFYSNLCEGRVFKFQLLLSLLTLISNAFPRLLKNEIEFSLLPLQSIDDTEIQYVGMGGRTFVFKVPINGKYYALKIDKESIISSHVDSYHKALIISKEYNWVKERFGDLGMVDPYYTIVTNAPFKKRNAVISITNYIDYRVDLFDYIEKYWWEFKNLIEMNPSLLRTLVEFHKRLKECIKKEGICPDLLGNNNIVLTIEGNEWKLKILDFTNLFHFKNGNKNTAANLIERLTLLDKALQDLTAELVYEP